MAPRIAQRAVELDEARRAPLDLIEALRAAGVFRMYAPRSHGGLELDLPTTIEVLTVLAAADGATGWLGMIGAGSAPFFSKLPRATYDQIYSGGPDVIIAGSAAPMGTAERVDGGYRVSGRWPFASGCQHADWIFSGVIVTEDGKPAPGPVPGAPLMRHLTLPASAWTIEDTWHVAGLKGTGSCHISLKEVFVPEAMTFSFGGPSCLPGPLYQSPLHLLPLLHAAPALGIAEGAIADLVTLADTGKQQMFARTTMRDSPLFQAELGRVHAEVRAARALLEAQTSLHWARALGGELQNDAYATEGTQAAVWITAACARAVDACYTLGGGSALYDTSPLQRRLRDIHAATQHRAVHTSHYAIAGAQRLGFPPRNPMFG